MEDILIGLLELVADCAYCDMISGTSTIEGGWDLEFDLEKVDPIERDYGDNPYKDLKSLLRKGLISKDVYKKLYANQKAIDATTKKINSLKKKNSIPYFELRNIMDELQTEIDNLHSLGRMDYEKHQEISRKIQDGLAEIAKFEREHPNEYYLR